MERKIDTIVARFNQDKEDDVQVTGSITPLSTLATKGGKDFKSIVKPSTSSRPTVSKLRPLGAATFGMDVFTEVVDDEVCVVELEKPSARRFNTKICKLC
ncbi:hypothetical protein PIB30_103339 [Stylosanthes scabra]|uniref:Uncharacterized protein n=1 Tax=Stylosanthes scabra TaxID=79078 RepID=A0ABU6TXE9_9FABA|nr:hypothetical protein [Stylosanthes scabra]